MPEPTFPPITTFSVPIPYPAVLKQLEQALVDEGFEIRASIPLSQLIRERVGVELAPATVMVLVHPVVAFQALLAGEDACFACLLQLTVRALPDGCDICFRPCPTTLPSDALTAFVAQESCQRAKRAINKLSPRAAGTPCSSGR